MSPRQFGFLIGFLIAWLWATTSFLTALAAVVGGLLVWAGVLLLEGDLDLRTLRDRFVSPSR